MFILIAFFGIALSSCDKEETDKQEEMMSQNGDYRVSEITYNDEQMSNGPETYQLFYDDRERVFQIKKLNSDGSFNSDQQTLVDYEGNFIDILNQKFENGSWVNTNHNIRIQLDDKGREVKRFFGKDPKNNDFYQLIRYQFENDLIIQIVKESIFENGEAQVKQFKKVNYDSGRPESIIAYDIVSGLSDTLFGEQQQLEYLGDQLNSWAIMNKFSDLWGEHEYMFIHEASYSIDRLNEISLKKGYDIITDGNLDFYDNANDTILAQNFMLKGFDFDNNQLLVGESYCMYNFNTPFIFDNISCIQVEYKYEEGTGNADIFGFNSYGIDEHNRPMVFLENRVISDMPKLQ